MLSNKCTGSDKNELYRGQCAFAEGPRACVTGWGPDRLQCTKNNGDMTPFELRATRANNMEGTGICWHSDYCTEEVMSAWSNC